jgi:NLP/P60 family protein
MYGFSFENTWFFYYLWRLAKFYTMKKVLLLVAVTFTLWSCSASQPARVYGNKNISNNNSYSYNTNNENPSKSKNKKSSKEGPNAKAASILSDAEKYLGAPYRAGGMTYSGFDCSGFVNTVFAENNIKLTRRSADQAKEGVGINIENVKHGDLLFFATAGGKRVSHVGIVHTITNDGEIKFIHASTSKGVIISSLEEAYWDKAFLFARRVL